MKKRTEEDFLLGNDAIARGALEAGVDFAAGYPGTPSTEILENLAKTAKEYGMHVEWSTNEKVAFELAMGASLAGLRAMITMKHAGFNWIADPLSVAVLGGVRGGLLIVTADDPGCHSSANEQDNRFYGLFFKLLTLEPSDPQEAKDMTKEAFSLSEKTQLPVILRSVTRVSHGRSNIRLGEIRPRERRPFFQKDPPQRYFISSKRSVKGHEWLVSQQPLLEDISNKIPFNKVISKEGAKCIVASGVAYSYVKDALGLLKLAGPTILKLGSVYPLPKSLVKEAISGKETILVVEEGSPFVELQLKALACDLGVSARILGKMSGHIAEAGDLNVVTLAKALAAFLGQRFTLSYSTKEIATPDILPTRTQTFCPGCPHNALAFAVKDIIRKRGREPFVGLDIGCYAIMSGAPYQLGDLKYSMGSGIGVASGMSKALGEKTVAFIGDGTFFHAGIPELINSVCNKSNITIIISDNGTTGMTGGQPNPGTGMTLAEGPTNKLSLERLVEACGVDFVRTTDPYDVEKTKKIVEEALDYDGVSVVVSIRGCALEEDRVVRRMGKQISAYEVDRDKCFLASAPYCQATCPLHIDASGYVGLISEGKFDEALKLIREKLPFPGIMARVCTHPCEDKCKRGEFDEAVAINALKRSAVDYGKTEDAGLPIAEEKAGKIAIVGGGPAGLMAAYTLRKKGYSVTIFDALPFLGGAMATCIPGYRLPREVLRGEIEIIERMGVEVRLNTRVGVDVELSDIRKNFDSVFIATGAGAARKIAIDNWDDRLEGCMDGVEFLRKINSGERVEPKDKVIIIGGGSVAVDCARSSLRLGFSDVVILYRRSKAEMPGRKDEIHEAEKEGARIEFLAAPRRVIAENGKVAGVEFVRTELGDPDVSGRRRPIPIKGSEFIINTDIVLLAAGEQPDLTVLHNAGVSAAGEGLICADPLTQGTNVPGIFAGGDAATGPLTVIDALAAGKKAAISIERYLNGEDLTTGRETEGPFQTNLVVTPKAVIAKPRKVMPTLPLEQRQRNFDEVELGLTREEAVSEAQRSLSCECHACIRFFSCAAIGKENNQTVIDSSVCDGCGVCTYVCPQGAIAKT
jgi:indolepyruvate ferredoxin oxidoreductase alpha subunit